MNIRIDAGRFQYEVNPDNISTSPLYHAQILRDAASNIARRMEEQEA